MDIESHQNIGRYDYRTLISAI